MHAGLGYPLAVVRRCADQAEALALKAAAAPFMARFPYASLTLYGRGTPLVVFRAATAQTVDADLLAEIDQCFGLSGAVDAIVYHDARRGIDKKAVTVDGTLFGVRLAGETLAQTWLKAAMAEDALDSSLMRFVLAPSAKPPVAVAARNIVCKCADISDTQIQAELAAGADLGKLQDKLKCGTFCGGCLPDIKRMVAEYGAPQTVAA